MVKHQYLFGFLSLCAVLGGGAVVACSKQSEMKNKKNSILLGTFSPEGGPWGEWKPWVYCPENSWAVGFSLRSERGLGSGDDTALNAIKLVCSGPYNNDVAHIESHPGLWGEWNGFKRVINAREYLNSAQMLVETDPHGDDDTAANDINFATTNGNFMAGGSATNFGTWRGWASCGGGEAINGLRVRFEETSSGNDDTALNAVEFNCTSYVPLHQSIDAANQKAANDAAIAARLGALSSYAQSQRADVEAHVRSAASLRLSFETTAQNIAGSACHISSSEASGLFSTAEIALQADLFSKTFGGADFRNNLSNCSGAGSNMETPVDVSTPTGQALENNRQQYISLRNLLVQKEQEFRALREEAQALGNQDVANQLGAIEQLSTKR